MEHNTNPNSTCYSILDWLYSNDTSFFAFGECSKTKVIDGSKIFKEVSTQYEFMAVVVEDITNEKYRGILVLWTIIVPVIFTLIVLLGTLGNLLVIYVIMSHAFRRTYTHVLLMNLAIADISFLICCVPFQAHKYASLAWTFGDLSCKLIQYVTYVTLYVTIWTLVCIAILRYYIIVRNKKRVKHINLRPMIMFTGCSWIFISLLNIPTALSFEVRYIGNYTYCGMKENAIETLIVTLFIMGYMLPLIIVITAYSSILHYLFGMKHGTKRRNRGLHAAKGILTVVWCFTLAWLPFHIHALISVYGTLPQGVHYEIVHVIWYFVAYSNSVVNPFIYNYVCKDFRNAFRQVLVCKESNYGNHRALKPCRVDL